MNNIILIPDYHFFKNHHTTVRIDMLNSIKNNNLKYIITIIYSDHDINDAMNIISKLKPKLIIFMDINAFQDNSKRFDFVFNLNIPTYIFIEDTYYITNTSLCPYVNKTNGIIFWYKNELLIKSYKNFFPNKIITSIDSRFVNTNIYKDYKLEKKYDILLYGCRKFYYPYKKENLETIQNYIKKYENFYNCIVDNNTDLDIYVLRTKLENILIKYSNKYNLKICPIQGDYIFNEELSKLINQSYLTIACPTICDVMVFKHLEIAASKSVILGNYPTDYKDLFEGNIVKVNEFMTEDEIIDIIDNALSDKNKLNEMSNRLYEKIHDEHNLQKAQESFNNLFSELI